VVILASPAPRQPSPQHLELMRAFTNQAGIAFQNAKLYQSTRTEQDRIIHNENEMRQKLARDLHDGPTQKMAGLTMQLDYIEQLIDRNPAEAKRELTKARAIAQQTVKEIRTALFALRPLALETKGLSAALKQYGERLRETENIHIQVDPGNFGSELDVNIAATVFAIIDEAVTNARKHARRAPIYVSAEKRSNTLVATIRDEGAGFDVDKVLGSYEDHSSLGLQNMRDRAMLINGDLRIDSTPGRGTRVTLIVPLPPAVVEVGD
jgi:signal transduction histidine kinase